jgi:hypothetical protein
MACTSAADQPSRQDTSASNFTFPLFASLRSLMACFDSLTGKLQNAFRNLRGLGKISESNVADSLREVRLPCWTRTSISRW